MKWRGYLSLFLFLVRYISNKAFFSGLFLSSVLNASVPKSSSPTLTLTRTIKQNEIARSIDNHTNTSLQYNKTEWTTYQLNVNSEIIAFQVIEDLEHHRVALAIPGQTLMSTLLFEPSQQELTRYRKLQSDRQKVGLLNSSLSEQINQQLKEIGKKTLYEKWYLGNTLHCQFSSDYIEIGNESTDNPGLVLELVHGVFPRLIPVQTMVDWGWIEPLRSKDILTYLINGTLFEGTISEGTENGGTKHPEGSLQHPGHFTASEFQFTTSYEASGNQKTSSNYTSSDLFRAWPVNIKRMSGESECIIWFEFQRKLGRCIIHIQQNKIKAIRIVDPFGFILSSGSDLKFKLLYPMSSRGSDLLQSFIDYNFVSKKRVSTKISPKEIMPIISSPTRTSLISGSWALFRDNTAKDEEETGDMKFIDGQRFTRSFQLLPPK